MVAASPMPVMPSLRHEAHDDQRLARHRRHCQLVGADGRQVDQHGFDRFDSGVLAHGQLTVPALGLSLIAQQVPAEQAAQLSRLLAFAAQPPAGTAPAAAPADDPATDGPRQGSVLDGPDAAYLEEAATTRRDLDALAPGFRRRSGPGWRPRTTSWIETWPRGTTRRTRDRRSPCWVGPWCARRAGSGCPRSRRRWWRIWRPAARSPSRRTRLICGRMTRTSWVRRR